eukprot:1717556-Amphidinium_carterae.1
MHPAGHSKYRSKARSIASSLVKTSNIGDLAAFFTNAVHADKESDFTDTLVLDSGAAHILKEISIARSFQESQQASQTHTLGVNEMASSKLGGVPRSCNRPPGSNE